MSGDTLADDPLANPGGGGKGNERKRLSNFLNAEHGATLLLYAWHNGENDASMCMLHTLNRFGFEMRCLKGGGDMTEIHVSFPKPLDTVNEVDDELRRLRAKHSGCRVPLASWTMWLILAMWTCIFTLLYEVHAIGAAEVTHLLRIPSAHAPSKEVMYFGCAGIMFANLLEALAVGYMARKRLQLPDRAVADWFLKTLAFGYPLAGRMLELKKAGRSAHTKKNI